MKIFLSILIASIITISMLHAEYDYKKNCCTQYDICYCSISDSSDWITYTKSNSLLPDNEVISIMIDSSNIKWIGTLHGGLLKIEKDSWTVFDTSNSSLPSNAIYSTVYDKKGNLWIGTAGGLVKYDGKLWSVYDTSGSALPGIGVSSLAVDDSNTIWIGMGQKGVVKYDGKTWKSFIHETQSSSNVKTVAVDQSNCIWVATAAGLSKFDGITWSGYKTSNSGLPANYLFSVAIDKNNYKWISTWGSGLVCYDGINWIIYNVSNSGLPNNIVFSTFIDTNDDKWIATKGGGLAYFNGVNWKVFTSGNSGLCNDFVGPMAKDKDENLWICTDSGLSVLKKDGMVSAVENSGKQILYFSLEQNFPNPFNPTTTISYSLGKESAVELKVFDILGREVSTLVNKEQSAGEYKIQFDGTSLPSGIYIYTIQADEFRDSRKLLLLK